MLCDTCKKDNDYFDLMWNGRYRHNDSLFTIHKHKMLVCTECWNDEIAMEEKYPELYETARANK